jgi:hypothetical protein
MKYPGDPLGVLFIDEKGQPHRAPIRLDVQ